MNSSGDILSVIIGIVTTDRDIHLSMDLYNSIIANTKYAKVSSQIVVVTRNTDTNTIAYWSNRSHVITIDHYEISARHNWPALVKKRNIVLGYARRKVSNCVWFVDSDIISPPETLKRLLDGSADVMFAPYIPKWFPTAVVGVSKDANSSDITNEISLVEATTEYPIKYSRLTIGGFGCTLIRGRALSIDAVFGSCQNTHRDVHGEDIGFFLQCEKNKIPCEWISLVVEHR